MKNKFSIVALAIFVCCSSFIILNTGEMKVINDEETRDVPYFHSVKCGIAANVTIKQGSNQELIIDAEPNVLEKIVTKVNNDELVIKFSEPRINLKKNIDIHITMKDVKGLTLAGSGNMNAPDQINSDEIKLVVSGSGNININSLAADNIESTISGSGNIKVSGNKTADELNVNISGSGNVNTENLTSEVGNIRISGSGSARVNCQSTLDARIAGSGNVYYAGSPKIDASVSGSGKVKGM